MINHRGSFYLGVFVFLIPFLGFPTVWKMGLILFSGLILILMSIRIPSPRKPLKAKSKKDSQPELISENAPSVQIAQVSSPLKVSEPLPQAIQPIPSAIPIIKIEHVSKNSPVKKTKQSNSGVRTKSSKVDSLRRPNIGQ